MAQAPGNITNLIAVVSMAVNSSYAMAVRGLVATLARRRYLNMGFYRAATIDDLAQGAEAQFTLVATEPLAIQSIQIFSALGAAEIMTGLWIKVQVGDTTVIPSGCDLTGDGLQSDDNFIPLETFNGADTLGQMLCLLTPGGGNQSTQAIITIVNRAAVAVNDAIVVVHGARLAPQRF